MRDNFDIEKNKITKEEVFYVPSNFLSQLENNILNKTVDKTKVEEKKTNLIHWYYWPIAASILVGVGLLFLNLNSNEVEYDYLSNVSNEEIYNYLEFESMNDQLYDEVIVNNVSIDYLDYLEFELEDSDIYDELDLSDLEDIMI